IAAGSDVVENTGAPLLVGGSMTDRLYTCGMLVAEPSVAVILSGTVALAVGVPYSTAFAASNDSQLRSVPTLKVIGVLLCGSTARSGYCQRVPTTAGPTGVEVITGARFGVVTV